MWICRVGELEAGRRFVDGSQAVGDAIWRTAQIAIEQLLDEGKERNNEKRLY